MFSSVVTMAMHDITNEFPTNQPDEVWYVIGKHLNNKETTRLNRELGVHLLNMKVN